METKSRYEVISELEMKKREYIKERDGLDDKLKSSERQLIMVERERDDTIREFDRRINDMKEDIEHFKETILQRKDTIIELIRSIDESLKRFSTPKE